MERKVVPMENAPAEPACLRPGSGRIRCWHGSSVRCPGGERQDLTDPLRPFRGRESGKC